MSSPATPSIPSPAPSRGLVLKCAPWLACAAAVGSVAFAASDWHAWIGNRTVQSTQNAFVKAEPAVLSARVGGYIRDIPVMDYQTVKAGDLIAEIVRDDYEVGVRSAEAALAKAQAVLDNLGNEAAQQRAAIAQAQAELHAAEARVTHYQKDHDRTALLVTRGAVSRKSFDEVQTELSSATASREAAVAALSLAQRQLDTLAGQRAQRAADRDAAAASLASAKLELSHTRIVAPFDGVLGRRSVQIGSLVGSGTQIVTIVPLLRPYVIANYKETQLQNVRPGQPVEITVDALPGRSFRGRVERIAPMSGNESSLLPTDNATGNFTKVIQRIPVRVELEPGQIDLSLLRPGMSAGTRIDTLGVQVASYGTQKIAVAIETYTHAAR